jgi:putative ABC transport system permease protein
VSLWRQISRGIRSLANSADADRDVADEVQHYLAEATAAHLARGLTPAEAARAARRDLGNPTLVHEDVRSSGWEHVVWTLFADLRYGSRRFRRSPGFTAMCLITLALGIGATTAIFGAVYPILFEPLPYPDGDRLAMIWDAGGGGARSEPTFGTFREVEQRSRTFESVAVMKRWQPTLTGDDRPERLDGQRVSAGYFQVLGMRTALGHDFNPSDDRPGGSDVAVLSHALWARRFGSDPGIIGRQIRLDGDRSFTVVGVMPATFENVLAPAAEIWAPLQYDMSLPVAWGHHLRMVGRLRPGIRAADAARDLDGIARAPVPQFPRVPWAALKRGLPVVSLREDVTGHARPALLAVMGAVILVLVIACVNVTNLLLARGAQREGEFAMRAALGAERRRLVRQLMTETLLLASAGGAAGIAVAQLGVRTLIAVAPPGLPRVSAIGVDRYVFAFALGITTLVAVIIGIVPAWHAFRGDVQSRLQRSSRTAAASHQWTRRTLVAAEVALAVMLLVSAGLLVRSLRSLFAVQPGFDVPHLLTMQVQTSGSRFDKPATDRFFAEALEAVRRVPGVTAAGFSSQLPLSGDDDEFGARFEGDDPNGGYNVFRYAVTPGYLEAVRIPLLRGRLLEARDTQGAPPAVLITESLAKSKFGTADPIGRRVRIGPSTAPLFTIVGIVGDVKQLSLAASDPDAVYHTTTQSWFVDDTLSLAVRTMGDPAALAPAIRSAIWSVDKDQAISRVETMDNLVARTAAERHFASIVFEAFGLVALILAATGIYGVLAGSVTARTREIGVRAALGASRADILALVAGQGARVTIAGMAAGLAGAVAASRALTTMLFSVSRFDWPTYAGAMLVIGATAATASAWPAWRAAHVDPAITLKSE